MVCERWTILPIKRCNCLFVTSFVRNIADSILRKAFIFSGSILISRGDKVLYSKSFGYSDREKGTKFDKHTVFDIGSITKQFLATAIIKLSEQGLLTVEDEISKYFKGVPR